MLVEKEETCEEPQLKRIKFDNKELCLTKQRMECVLDDVFIKELLTVEVYIGKILNKRNISKVIIQLNALLPIPSLQHLKRVKGGAEVILCVAENIDNVKEFLENLGFDISLISSHFQKICVTAEVPKTRAQFLKANKCWPCNFHEEKHIEKLVNNNYSNEELDLHEKWMRLALDCRGTVIVDPKDNTLKASSSDFRTVHPMKHSVMVAVDNVARSQGGGAWGLPTGQVVHNKNEEDGPYLCTGYNVYTIKEPCVMCAMALVHSRVKNVFYSLPGENGALGTALKLHSIKSLNHHFEVFRGLLREESSKMLLY